MTEIAKYNRLRGIISKKYRESDGTEKSLNIDEIVETVQLEQNRCGNNVRVEDFIGRTEQVDIIRKAINEHKKIIQITGIDGIGKSEICRQIYSEYMDAYEIAEDKEEEILPVYLHYEYNMDDTLVSAVNVQDCSKYIDSVDRVWKFFKQLSEKRKMIFFIDGVNKTLLEDESLNKLYMLNCTTVVTSVDNIFLNSPELCRVRIGSLPDQESVDLFMSVYDMMLYDHDSDNLIYIVKELADNHPLTIKLLASIAKSKSWEISDLMDFLEDYDFKMSAIFMYSEDLEILIEEYRKLVMLMEFSEEEKSILEAFSILPYDNYALKFCVDWMETDCSVHDFGMMLEKLADKGWLERNDELQYSMNSVIASVIRHVLCPKIDNHMHLIKMCDKYLQLYALKINDDKHAYWRMAENIVNEMYTENVYSLGQLAMRAGSIFQSRMEYERARSLYRRSVVIYENVFGRDHLETANAYYKLADTYEKGGDFNNALTHYNVALEIQEATFMGKEQEYTGNTYASMANIYARKGNYDNSIQYYNRSLEIKEKQLGRENLSVAVLYTSMAGVFCDMGNFEKSLTYYNTAIGIREKINGKNDNITVQTYASIANVYRKLGDYTNSIKYFKRAIEIYEKLYGKEHLYISYAYNGMAGSYAKMGKFDKAKQCCYKSIEMCEHIFGKRSMAIATAYNNMALVCKEHREYDESEKYFALSLNIIEKILGHDNIYSAQVYKGMAGLYKASKKYTESMAYYEKAALIRKNILGGIHPDTLDMVEKMDSVKKIIEATKVVKIVKNDEE